MKLKISESKIRKIVNEEVFKNALTNSLRGQKWPSYTTYLAAELLQLEWKQNLKENTAGQRPSPEWIAETAGAFGLSEDEITEATRLMDEEEDGSEELEEGFFKALAKPYVNLYKTFTNITQSAANLTDPDQKKDVAAATQVAQALPEPEEIQQQAKSLSPEEFMKVLQDILALLKKGDAAIDGDNIEQGLEATLDQAQGDLEQGAQAVAQGGGAEGGGAEGGGGQSAAIYRGKGGIGLQSHLAKAGIQGKAMGAVLKHIEKQLKAQGVTISEGILDEVQGHIWYGLVEDMLQERHGNKITLRDLLNEFDGPNRKAQKRGKAARAGRQALAKQKGMKGAIAGEAPAKAAYGPGSGPASAEAGAEAPAEKVTPTVKNTAPEGAAKIKVFKGKGGEGLQSALARSRDKLGIKQQQVAAIIKQVEIWANKNQIKVENITEDTFDAILSEISTKYRARKLQETINKLKNV
jgi:hypothetical protein